MNTPEILKEACQVLRRRVRYDGACLRLPSTAFPGDDTPVIKEATWLYVESWVVPLIDAIETGDSGALQMMCSHERGHPMDKKEMEAA